MATLKADIFFKDKKKMSCTFFALRLLFYNKIKLPDNWEPHKRIYSYQISKQPKNKNLVMQGYLLRVCYIP